MTYRTRKFTASAAKGSKVSAVQRSKTAARKGIKASAAMGILLSLLLGTSVYAAPTGGQVVSGSSTIKQAGNTTTINQGSQHTQINWQKFGIAKNETVNFVQPNKSAVALNKVIGSEASAIYGKLNANGQVFLVNPNGILFGKTASVNVGGLVASTLDVTANENGKYTFAGSGGTVANAGSLTAGGNIVLAASIVNNTGTITNNGGTTQLVAADQITLDTGEAYTLTVDKGALNAQIHNGGAIIAGGGQVYLTAKGRDALSSAVINHTGIIEANAAESGDGGKIVLLSDMETGTTKVSGTLNAKGTTGAGGFIETSGAKVKIADSAKISTASEQGKYGTWLIDPKNFTIGTGLEDTNTGISGTALGTKLASNNVEIKTVNDSGSEDGDIFVNDTVSWDAGTTLTLNAYRDIEINNAITASAGKVALYYGQGSANGTIDGTEAAYTINMADGYKSGSGKINLSAGQNFSTKLGSDGAVKTYTVITALGDAGDENKDTTNSLQGLAYSGKLTGNYVLGTDIAAGDTSGWNSGAGFASIGNDTNKFTGTFDGLGHTIDSLTINRQATDYVGLFGYTSGAAVSNVGLVGGSITGENYVGGLVGEQVSEASNVSKIENAYTTGTVSGFSYIGGLVGYQSGSNSSITNAYATGTVKSTGDGAGGLVGAQVSGSIKNAYAAGAADGNNYVGGLVGNQNSGSIENAYATGAVTGTGGYAGGLVGFQISSGSIENAYATGAVSGNDEVGGLVGYQVSGSIENAYATGAVSGSENVGGLVGLQWDALGDSTIKNVYAAGAVKGTTGVGGLVGKQTGGSIKNAYWDVDTTGKTDAIGDKEGTGTNTFQAVYYSNGTPSALAQNSYGDFDFTSTWYMVEGQTRPLLRALAVQKSSDGKYHITNLNDLQSMILDLTGSYVLDNDIDASATAASVTDNNTADIWGGKGFAPIGTSTANFTGTFDGLGHTISDLTIDRSETENVGLFGYAYGATISNVGLSGGSITGRVVVGSLIGKQYGGKIENAYATGDVVGSQVVGGLVGNQEDGSITNAYATGEVRGKNYVGGLVGFQRNGSITNAYGTGIVFGDKYVGGLVGYKIRGSIENAYATGVVNGSEGVGGLVGKNDKGTITSSYWDTTTTGQEYSSGSDNSDGKTTAEMQTADTFDGWSMDTVGGQDKVWRIYEGYTSPLLKSFLKTVTVTADISNNNAPYSGIQQSAEVTNYKYNGGTQPEEVKGTASAVGTGTNAGSYAVTLSGLYSTQDGCDIVNDLGTFNIAKNYLTLSGTRAYDGTTITAGSMLTATGVNGETFTVTGNGDVSNLNSKNKQTGSELAAVNGLAVGTGNTQAALASNYYDLRTNGSQIDITARAITAITGITASDKTYNGATDAALTGTAVLEGKVAGDDLTVNTGSMTGTFADKNAGQDKTVNISGITLAGTDADNYTLSAGGTAVTTGNINQATLTISAAEDSKVYDGTTAGTKTYDGTNGSGHITVTGLVGGDTISGVTQAFNSKNVEEANTVAVQYTSLNDGTGSDMSGNYKVVNNTAKGTITPLAISEVTGITAQDKTYDGNTKADLVTTGAGFTNIISGDNLSVAKATGAFADKNAGMGKTVNISGITLGGKDSGNYTLTQTTATALAAINKANLTLVSGGRTYDGSAAIAGSDLTAAGVNGETFTLNGSGTLSSRNVLAAGSTLESTGDLALVQASGTNAPLTGNYNGLTTAVDTDIVLTKATLTINAAEDSKVYDGNTDGTKTYDGTNDSGHITVTGLQGTDTISGVTQAFNSKNVKEANTVTAQYTSINDGNNGGNYTVTKNTAKGTITPKALTGITGFTTEDKTYDGTTNAKLNTSGAELAGVLTGDDLSAASAAGTYATKNAGDNIGVSVDRNSIVLGGSDVDNYAVTSATELPALTGSISRAKLNITADDLDRNSGVPFAFTGTEFTASGLVTGEQVNLVTLASDGALLAAAPGSYAINISGARGSFDPANYVITYHNGTLTVRPMEAYKFASAYPKKTIEHLSKDYTLYDADYLSTMDDITYDLPTIKVIEPGMKL